MASGLSFQQRTVALLAVAAAAAAFVALLRSAPIGALIAVVAVGAGLYWLARQRPTYLRAATPRRALSRGTSDALSEVRGRPICDGRNHP